jgi:hypothetical protein
MKAPRSHSIIGVACALVAIVLVAPARAQDTRAQLQGEIEKTDRRIEQAESLVSATDVEAARFELSKAVEIQTQAKSEFAAAHGRNALDLTLRARQHADRAIAIVRQLPDPDRVLAQLERTRELMERARDRIEECNDDRARAMLRAGFEMQQRAEQQARDGRYLAALQLTTSARERTLRALRVCHLEENLKESAGRALRRTDDVLLRARDVVAAHGNEPARAALGRAAKQEDRAHADFEAGRYGVSLRLTQAARSFAFRAIRLSGGGL